MPEGPKDSTDSTADSFGNAADEADRLAQSQENLKNVTTELIRAQTDLVAETAKEVKEGRSSVETLLKRTEVLNKLKASFADVTKAEKEETQASKQSAAQTDLNTAATLHLIGSLEEQTRKLREAAISQADYRLELDQTNRMLQTATKGYKSTQKELQNIKNELRLTRKEFQEFSKVLQEGAIIGVDMSQLKDLQKELINLRGHAGGLREGAVAQQAISAGGEQTRRAFTDPSMSQKDFIQELRGMTQEAREVAISLRDSRKGGGRDETAITVSKGFAGNAKIMDDIGDSLSNMATNISGMAGGWGTTILGIPVLLAGITKGLVAGSAIWTKIAGYNLSQIFSLKQIATNTAIAAARSGGGGGGGGGGAGGGGAKGAKGAKAAAAAKAARSADPAMASRISRASGVAGKAAKSGGMISKAGRFAMSPKGAGVGLIASIVGMVAGEVIQSNAKAISEGTGVEEKKVKASGQGIGAAANVAGYAGTGAMLGSFGGPAGTAAGAAGGALLGIFMEWENITESFTGMFGKTKKVTKKVDDSETSLAILLNDIEGLDAKLASIKEKGQKGLEQEVGRFAEQQQVTAVRTGGGDLGGAQARQSQGRGKTLQIELAGYEAELARYSKQLAKIGPGHEADKRTIKEAQAKVSAQIEEAITLNMEAEKVGKALEPFAERLGNLKKHLVAAADAAKANFEVFGLITGSTADLAEASAALQESYEVTAKNNAEAAKAAEATAARNLEGIAKREKSGSITGEQASDERSQVGRDLAAGLAGLEAETTQAMGAAINAVFEEAQAVIDRREQSLTARSQATMMERAETGLTAARARGMTPGQRGAAAGGVAQTSAAQSQRLQATEAEDIATINTKMAKAIRGAGSAQKEQLFEAKRQEMITQRLKMTQESLNNAYEKGVQAAMERGNAEAALLDVQSAQLQAQKDVAETIGASFGTLHSIAQDMVKLKQRELQITNEQITKLKSAGVDENDPALQELFKKQAQQQAQVFKESIGVQRDFLDKALGRAFGAPSGSKFAPAMTERALFGEHTRGPGGMVIKGNMTRRQQQENLMRQGGALRNLGGRPGGEAGVDIMGGGVGNINQRGAAVPGMSDPLASSTDNLKDVNEVLAKNTDALTGSLTDLNSTIEPSFASLTGAVDRLTERLDAVSGGDQMARQGDILGQNVQSAGTGGDPTKIGQAVEVEGELKVDVAFNNSMFQAETRKVVINMVRDGTLAGNSRGIS